MFSCSDALSGQRRISGLPCSPMEKQESSYSNEADRIWQGSSSEHHSALRVAEKEKGVRGCRKLIEVRTQSLSATGSTRSQLLCFAPRPPYSPRQALASHGSRLPPQSEMIHRTRPCTRFAAISPGSQRIGMRDHVLGIETCYLVGAERKPVRPVGSSQEATSNEELEIQTVTQHARKLHQAEESSDQRSTTVNNHNV